MGSHFYDLGNDDIGDEPCSQASQKVGVELHFFSCKIIYLGMRYLSALPDYKQRVLLLCCHSSQLDVEFGTQYFLLHEVK